jgi:hypothetical protein
MLLWRSEGPSRDLCVITSVRIVNISFGELWQQIPTRLSNALIMIHEGNVGLKISDPLKIHLCWEDESGPFRVSMSV